MKSETVDALIGQLAADNVLRDALVIALIEQNPALAAAIQAKVAATAPGVLLSLPPGQQEHCQIRLQELKQFLRRAQE